MLLVDAEEVGDLGTLGEDLLFILSDDFPFDPRIQQCTLIACNRGGKLLRLELAQPVFTKRRSEVASLPSPVSGRTPCASPVSRSNSPCSRSKM